MKDQVFTEQIIETTKEKGDSLELAIEHIFKIARFKTKRNSHVAKYEIDVLANIGDRTIIIECKNYQNSNLTIRNLIHQWHSKNKIINAHKVILVLIGLQLKESDYLLANEFDMELWNQGDLTEMFNLTLKPKMLRERLLEKISLKPITIDERYRDEITYLVIKPILSGMNLTNETKYYYFNKWLRSFILTELQMGVTSKEDRSKHIQLFEGSKTKNSFLIFKTKRKEVDYWEKVYKDLSGELILGNNLQSKYKSYMDLLIKEFNSQNEYFEGEENFVLKTRKVIKSRLYNAIYFNTGCSFKKVGTNNEINVILSDDNDFEIEVTQITEQGANALNWIIESQHIKIYNEVNNNYDYKWFCSSLDETVEKIYRILEEFNGLNNKDKIVDNTLKSATTSISQNYSFS